MQRAFAWAGIAGEFITSRNFDWSGDSGGLAADVRGAVTRSSQTRA